MLIKECAIIIIFYNQQQFTAFIHKCKYAKRYSIILNRDSQRKNIGLRRMPTYFNGCWLPLSSRHELFVSRPGSPQPHQNTLFQLQFYLEHTKYENVLNRVYKKDGCKILRGPLCFQRNSKRFLEGTNIAEWECTGQIALQNSLELLQRKS